MIQGFYSNTDVRTVPALSNEPPEAIRLARLARQALIAEAELTPKPGLVDRRGAGAHTDLSLAAMRCSALTIERYFRRMAAISRRTVPSQPLREQLAFIGREAERAMRNATGGSNSHRGAIWVLGLLISAAAMRKRKEFDVLEIAKRAGEIASFEDRAAPEELSHGTLMEKRYGVSGARGEALRGFPHVVDIGLPMLRSTRANGATECVARLDALLSIIARLDDTCLLYRGGEVALAAAKKGAIAIEEAGGSGTLIGQQLFLRLDRRLIELGVSPGGSGDLFAATLFLDAAGRGQNEVEADRSGSENLDGTD